MGADGCGDYGVTVYVTVGQDGRSSRSRWGWAITRHSTDRRLVQKSVFLTEAGARLAGEIALKNFLRRAFDNKDVTGWC